MSRKPWTDAEVTLLREQYADSRTDILAEALGRSLTCVYQKALGMGLRKSAAYLASENGGRVQRGMQDPRLIASRFRPGHATWNKGLKGVVGVQPECRATQFKPGRPAHEARNYAPIGTLRISKDGYLERKVTDDPGVYPARRWVALHRLVWEAAHGPIPHSHIVVFRPGTKTTDQEAVTADRLECITRRENMLRNTYHRYGPEVAHLVQLRGAITRQINQRAKHEQDRDQDHQ